VVETANTPQQVQVANGTSPTTKELVSLKSNLCKKMIDGVENLIAVEAKLEKGVDIKTAMGKNSDILAHK